MYINKKYNDSFKDIQEYDYYRDTDFEKISAVASGILIHTEKPNINTIITAIYELSEKEIIKIQWKEQKNFLILKEHDKAKLDTLLPYEKSIVHFIFRSIEDTNEYCLEDILKETEENSTKNYILKDIEKEIKYYINEKYFSNIADYLKKAPIMSWLKLGSMLCTIIFSLGWPFVLLSFFTLNNPLSIILIIEYLINLIIVFYYSRLRFIKPTYKEELYKLYGLYSYMSDYSLLHEQEIRFYQLYNSYYVYAMGLGLADKFEKELGQDTLNNEVRTALQFYLQNRRNI